MVTPKARKLKSGTWFIQLRLGGESVPITAYTEKECIRQAQLTKAEYKAGKRIRDAENGISRYPTLTECIDRYIAKRDAVLSPSTIRGYKAIQRTRFLSVIDKSLSDMDDSDWQIACNAEAKLCSAKTLKNAWGFIASVILDTTGHSAPKVKLPQVIPNDRPFLEPEQIGPFIRAIHGKTVEIPALLALSSLRRSELLGLTWDKVDLDKRVIHISGASVMGPDNEMIYKAENKNASSARVVPIMIPELYEALKNRRQDSGLVVTCSPNNILQQVNRICRNNNLPLVGVHGLRHSFVSLAYHLGVPEKIVMQIGGWSDYQTMRKIYTHIARSDVLKYTSEFNDFFEKNAN